MAKFKKNPFITKTGIGKVENPFPTGKVFGHVAYTLEGLSIPREILVGFSFQLNTEPGNKNLIIGKVFFNPDNLSFEKEVIDGLPQKTHVFQGTGADTRIELIETDQRDFNQFQFLQDVDLVFFSKNDLEHLLMISNKLIISGCQIQYGVSLHNPPSNNANDKLNPDNFYFTLKIEVELPVAEGGRTPFPYTTVVVGQPCPPKWVPGSLLRQISESGQISPEKLMQNMRTILDSWKNKVLKAPPPESSNNIING